jgi:hypothetical protein
MMLNYLHYLKPFDDPTLDLMNEYLCTVILLYIQYLLALLLRTFLYLFHDLKYTVGK